MTRDNFASNRAAAAFEALRRGFDGVKGPDLGMFVIDPLAAETPEQTAERKAAERKPSLGIAHVLSIVATMLVVAALFTVVGAFYGASDPDAVKDLMPSVPSLSGERAEPEESAR